MSRLKFLFAFLALVLAAPAQAQTECPDDDASPCSNATLVADQDAVEPGSAFDVALRIEIEPKWHVYWENPGDSGLPVQIEWDVPESIRIEPLQNPFPERIDIAGLTSYAFEDEAQLLARVAVPEDFVGDELVLGGLATWLICADICLQAEQEVSLTIPIGTPTNADQLAAARALLPVQAEGWSASASPEDSSVVLRLTPPQAWAGSLEDAQFFPVEEGVLNHAAPQTFAERRGVWSVGLMPSPIAGGSLDRIRGVLVAADGQQLVGDARAIEIDAIVAEPSPVQGPQSATLGLGWALLFALGGGLILNLMPCVFPILSIKVLGFAEGKDNATLRRNGLAFGAGVLVSFWVLAGALLAFRAAGAGLGWGFQLQSPPIVAALAALMVLIGLNLLGVFEIGNGLASAGARADQKSGRSGAFLSGVLATIVATPCTAPFMGAALGYAIAAPVTSSLLVFTALGVGMALPYVLLSYFPKWTERLPRPGAWMVTLRQALAFPMFATAVWLLWVFGLQVGMNGVALLLMALVLLALATWFIGHWPAHSASSKTRTITRGLAVLSGVAALALAIPAASGGAGTGVVLNGQPRVLQGGGTSIAIGTSDSELAALGLGTGEGDWLPFTSASVDQMVADGQPVFIDFTAAWCLTCQVNKKTTLHTDAVDEAFERHGVTRVRADWTNRNPDITAMLDRFGRSGVPFYVLYPGGDAEPILLPETLTPGIVIDALASLPAGSPTASL
ncbi:MAG: thioredoxin family protein [Bacteroidota bacterium]